MVAPFDQRSKARDELYWECTWLRCTFDKCESAVYSWGGLYVIKRFVLCVPTISPSRDMPQPANGTVSSEWRFVLFEFSARVSSMTVGRSQKGRSVSWPARPYNNESYAVFVATS